MLVQQTSDYCVTWEGHLNELTNAIKLRAIKLSGLPCEVGQEQQLLSDSHKNSTTVAKELLRYQPILPNFFSGGFGKFFIPSPKFQTYDNCWKSKLQERSKIFNPPPPPSQFLLPNEMLHCLVNFLLRLLRRFTVGQHERHFGGLLVDYRSIILRYSSVLNQKLVSTSN